MVGHHRRPTIIVAISSSARSSPLPATPYRYYILLTRLLHHRLIRITPAPHQPLAYFCNIQISLADSALSPSPQARIQRPNQKRRYRVALNYIYCNNVCMRVVYSTFTIPYMQYFITTCNVCRSARAPSKLIADFCFFFSLSQDFAICYYTMLEYSKLVQYSTVGII